jgi:hypothetical protein
MQAIEDQKEFLNEQMKQTWQENESKSEEAQNGREFLIPVLSSTAPEKHEILMALSENYFNDQHLFIYNQLWKIKDKTNSSEINLFNKKLQFLNNFIGES